MEPQNPVTPDPLNPQPVTEPTGGLADPQPASDPSPLDAQFTQPEGATPAPEVPQVTPPPAQPLATDLGATPLAAPGTQASDPYAQPGIDPITGGPEAPVSVAGPVPLAQPASMPAFMNPAPLTGQVNAGVNKKKSKLVLIIVVVIALLLAGGGAAYALTRKKADKPAETTPTSSTTTEDKKTDVTNTQQQTSPKSATKADYSTDFEEVCKGGAISNAADYTSNKTAIVYTFHSSVITPNSWNSDLVGYGKSYYLKDLDKFDTISVVACAKYVDGSASGGIDCEYQKTGGEKVTIKYQSTKYQLTFYEAKTGKKISDGGEISGSATKCPSSILYDADKKMAYADPDDDALEAALDAFVK